MRIGVVADKPVPPWSVRQIMLAIEELGGEAIYVRPSDITSFVGGANEIVFSSTLKPFDVNAIILRDLGVATTVETYLRRVDLFKHMELLGIPVVNPVESYVTARDKYLSLCLLSKAGIPVPKTIVVEDHYAAIKAVEMFSKAVIKPLIGSLGFGVIKVDNPDLAYTIGKTLTQIKQPIYVQEFIDKPNRDIRILVVGDEIVIAYYRIQINPENWKTNIAQGAVAKPIEKIDKELEEYSFKVLDVLKLHYAGIDFGETKNGYVIFEVNASPQWRGIQKVTGINPAKNIVKYVMRLAKK
ncbi:RimK family alpha-L-glutamate ligase [Ignisphaera sp. 4213-co]|uniref:RimK family alpha-L-glutamate ligase n=1 Tax=Ignisphaera cupida TaxID=3050454 RepID=A0ABD4Z696_9CREN|nr:RimK family alpha-L-glutamate ligase [Ignisphaera sp. 4213-co]MDK6028453.1 RimK family alpha-L-glutamate ligase [Ignisphaera sp. 4213-co]